MKIEKKKLSATEKQEMIQLLHDRFMQNEKLLDDDRGRRKSLGF